MPVKPTAAQRKAATDRKTKGRPQAKPASGVSSLVRSTGMGTDPQRARELAEADLEYIRRLLQPEPRPNGIGRDAALVTSDDAVRLLVVHRSNELFGN